MSVGVAHSKKRIVGNIDEMRQYFDNNNLKKDVAVPLTQPGDEDNPRVCKSGGRIPILPHEKPDPELVIQLYVPLLPQFIKDLIPARHQQSLIVAGADGVAVNMHVYTADQLDSLTYAKPSQENFSDMSGRVITGWEQGEMYPPASTNEAKVFADLYYTNELEEMRQLNGKPLHTYLGGWAYFWDTDVTPENMSLLLNISHRVCGLWQIWMSTGEDFGAFSTTFGSELC